MKNVLKVVWQRGALAKGVKRGDYENRVCRRWIGHERAIMQVRLDHANRLRQVRRRPDLDALVQVVAVSASHFALLRNQPRGIYLRNDYLTSSTHEAALWRSEAFVDHCARRRSYAGDVRH